MPRFQSVISLGPTCRARQQTIRYFGHALARKGIFDWQGTPPSITAMYFNNDFKGMFELEDLILDTGAVRNLRYGTFHQHQFRRSTEDSPLTMEEVVAAYPAARARHDGLGNSMRRYLSRARRVLFVMSYRNARPGSEEWVRLAIEKRFPLLSFEILSVNDNEAIQARLTAGNLKPRDEWRGDQEIFDRAFAPFMPMMISGPAYLAAVARAEVQRAEIGWRRFAKRRYPKLMSGVKALRRSVLAAR
jgi:hypothetical protein